MKKEESVGRKNNKGMSTLEILIAFAISLMCIGTVILVTFENQYSTIKSQTHQEAIAIAGSNLENARAVSKQNYTLVKNCDDSTIKTCPGVLHSSYVRKINIDQSSLTQCSENIESIVTWIVNNQTFGVNMLTNLVDIFTSIALGADCPGTSPYGNWSDAEILNSIDTTPTTLKATGIDVKNKIVYMSTDPSTAADPDFFIFDATNVSESSKPIFTASLNTGPGIPSVDVAGSYAYVANDSKNGQLQVIDISDKNNPILKSTLNVVPFGADTNTVGNKVFYYNKTIFLGLRKNNYEEFFVIDASDPLNLDFGDIKGRYEFNASINSISIRGDYAFIGTPNNEELTILDVNPDSANFMQRITGIDTPGGSGNGKSIDILGDKLYLGRTVGNIEFYIIDMSNSSNPKTIASYDVNSSINDMVVIGDYAFLITTQANSELQILDISDNLNPILIKKYDFTDDATGLDYEDNFIYISSENGDALTIIKPKL